MGALVAGPETAGFDPGESIGEVLRTVLAEVVAIPWLIGLLVLLAIGKLVQLGRAVVHGGHGRDPRRTFSRAEKAALLGRAGHRCEHHSWLLGRCRETRALQADHVHPHSRGGATDVANGQALCRRHNKRKADRVPGNWELGRLARRRGNYFPPGTPTAVARYGALADQPVEASRLLGREVQVVFRSSGAWGRRRTPSPVRSGRGRPWSWISPRNRGRERTGRCRRGAAAARGVPPPVGTS